MSDLVGKYVMFDAGYFIGAPFRFRVFLVTSVSGKRAYVSELKKEWDCSKKAYELTGEVVDCGYKKTDLAVVYFDDMKSATDACTESSRIWDEWFSAQKRVMQSDCIRKCKDLGGVIVR